MKLFSVVEITEEGYTQWGGLFSLDEAVRLAVLHCEAFEIYGPTTADYAEFYGYLPLVAKSDGQTIAFGDTPDADLNPEDLERCLEMIGEPQ